MGAALSWFAVQGCGRDEALAELGLELGFEVGDDFPERLGFGELPGGWLLFVSSDMDEMFESRFVALSRHGPAVGCSVEERVMFFEARGFADGAEVWRVLHNSEKGADHLEISGKPPLALETVRAEAQDFVAEVPLDLAKAICGFKHDDAWPETFSFFELRRARPVKPAKSSGAKGRPGLLQRLFGRG